MLVAHYPHDDRTVTKVGCISLVSDQAVATLVNSSETSSARLITVRTRRRGKRLNKKQAVVLRSLDVNQGMPSTREASTRSIRKPNRLPPRVGSRSQTTAVNGLSLAIGERVTPYLFPPLGEARGDVVAESLRAAGPPAHVLLSPTLLNRPLETPYIPGRLA